MEEKKTRKKTWSQKVKIVKDRFLKVSQSELFATIFYEKLFYLNPDIEKHFAKTSFKHQKIAIMQGLNYLFGFYDSKDINAKKQIKRIAISHSKNNLNIHPHYYYYWIDALIMTCKELDEDSIQDEEYYWREVLSFPISFIISMYLYEDEN